jgi:signal transduction histidine kinase
LSNAIKYSPESEIITICIDEINTHEIQIIIEDQGIGIPPEEIKYLLEPFYRASNVGTVKGTGFGMTVIKRFVELHHGRIFIESVLHKGTKVSIVLPHLQHRNTKDDLKSKIETEIITFNKN